MKLMQLSFIAACVASLFTWSCELEGRPIRVGQRIHHDDFEDSVISVWVSKTIGEEKETVTAAGNFYIVTFLVENHAERVNHELVDSIACIMDEEGSVHENRLWAQKALSRIPRFGWTEEHVTPAGGSGECI